MAKTTTCGDCAQDLPYNQTLTLVDLSFDERVEVDYCPECAWQQIGCGTPGQYEVTRNEQLLNAHCSDLMLAHHGDNR